MAYVSPLGNPSAPVWVILDRPFSSDEAKAELLSGGIGYAFKKMFAEAGLRLSDCYFCCRRPDTKNLNAFSSVENLASGYKPPLLLLVGEVGSFFLPELRVREGQDTWRTQLNKYVGSLLSSPSFSWPHYCMPLIDPSDLMKDWRERNVTTYIDLGKAKDELEYFKTQGTLQLLPTRNLISSEMDDDFLLQELDRLRTYPALSEDIETVYPKAGSEYYGVHPGIPVTIGIAPCKQYGISFSLFRKTPSATLEVWRAFDKLHNPGLGLDCPLIIGQNFFNFDSYFYRMLGFTIPRERISDTLLRHHILWPELPHKLQFLTRQYTRQPYYKDEGKTWSVKNMNGLRHYNCLDVTVTYEVWEEQEKEFAQRPHLR